MRILARSCEAARALATLGAFVCAYGLAGCSGESETPAPTLSKRGNSRGVAAPAAERAEQAPADEQAPTAEEESPEEGLLLKKQAEDQQPSAASGKPTEAADEKRNFADELTQQMSGASRCLHPRPASSAPKSIDISLTAVVMPTGSVGRSEAVSSMLEPAEIACIRREIEAARFAPPIEDAPFSVNAVLHIDQAPPPTPAQPSGEASPTAPPAAAVPPPAAK